MARKKRHTRSRRELLLSASLRLVGLLLMRIDALQGDAIAAGDLTPFAKDLMRADALLVGLVRARRVPELVVAQDAAMTWLAAAQLKPPVGVTLH